MEPPNDNIPLDLAKLRRKRQYKGDVIFAATRIVARSMTLRNGTMSGWEWMLGLKEAEFGTVVGAIDALDALIGWGEDIDVQFIPVQSKCGLRALWVHEQPHTNPLTILGCIKGETVWVATGHKTRPDRLTKSQIEQADNITAEWLTVWR